MDHELMRERLGVIAWPMLLVAAFVVYLLTVRDRLPPQVAVHWGPDGTPDGFADPTWLVWMFGGLSAVLGGLFAVFALTIRRSVVGGRWLKAMPGAIVGFVLGIGVVVVASQVDTDAPPVLDGAVIIPVMLAGVASGLIGGWIAGPAPSPPARTAPATPGPRATEQARLEVATWEGATPPGKPLAGAAFAVVVLAVVLGWYVSWWTLVILLPVVLLLLASSRFRVVVGPGGVVVAGLLAGLPRIRIPLAHIAAAEVGEVEAMSFGGWGIRLGVGGESAVITRSGPALVIRRTDGAVLRVSLDRPEEAAAVLSALVGRS